MNKLTIGQMAQMNHVSEQTLRYYDKIGIFKPLEIDKQNGYRFYSIKQSARLDMIQYMKSLEIPYANKLLNEAELRNYTRVVDMETALDRFYEACSYDKEKAIPTLEKYLELGMDDVAEKLYNLKYQKA